MYTHDEVLNATLDYFNGNVLAAEVWLSKYAMRDGETFLELTPKDMHRRLAKEFARIERKYSSKLTEQDIFELFDNFDSIIPQGSVMSVVGTGQKGSASNCVVLPEIYDSYGGIAWADQALFQLMKRRAGVGLDITPLRPSGMEVENVAQNSSGAVSFMHRFSNSTREVSQKGRRGALMLTMDCRHPDIEEFIQVKQDLTKVTGANISVKFTDDFLKAVENDTEFVLQFPVESKNPKVTKTVKAKQVWDKFVKAAHNSAEPGIAFWDRIRDYSTDHNYTPIITSNPLNACGLLV